MAKVESAVAPDGTVARRRAVSGDLRYDDGDGEWQRWNGRRWANAAYSFDPARLKDPTPLDRDPSIPEARRERALTLAVEDEVATKRAAVVFTGPTGVVLAYQRPISHFLHAVLTLLTGGIWGFVWVALVLARRETRTRLEVDAWGHVWARPVAST